MGVVMDSLGRAKKRYREKNISSINFDLRKNNILESEIIKEFAESKSKKILLCQMYEIWKHYKEIITVNNKTKEK